MDALAPAGRRRLLAGAAAATACYGLYRLYLHHRGRIAAALSLADALSQVGSDLADFLRSDSDQVPRSLLQLSKLAASDHVSSAASALSESLASGALRAFSSHRAARGPDPPSPPLHDRILDRLLSPDGAGFASAVLGSFARNLVLSCRDPEAQPRSRGQPDWLAALCSDRGKEAAAELVRVFVSTAVAAYLDRTAAVRGSDQVLAGVTNPKHEAKLKDLLVSVCNGAVETFVRTSRQVTKEASISRAEAAVVQEVCNSGPSCVMERVSTTLTMPSNRRFVLDVTGRVTAEMVRSFLEFSTQRVSAGARKSIVVAANPEAAARLAVIRAAVLFPSPAEGAAMERAEAEVEMAGAGDEVVHTPHSAPPTAPSARVSIWESVRACGVWGRDVDKAELRRRVVMPLYARRAVAAAVAEKDEAAGVAAAAAAREEKVDGEEDGLEVVTPMVVFVNSKSGGRHGPELKVRLHELISKEQVFDLSVVKPSDFVRYGLGCLEKLADQGDNCAKDIRANLRIMVAGGDGTVGWVLGCLQELNKSKREPVPPTGIIPLGTGNDLARSFGWGGSFPFGWRSAVKRYLNKAVSASAVHLDSWQVVIRMPEGEITELPHALKKAEPADQLEFSKASGSELTEKASSYKGVFYNYLSIGMDAQVAYGFHHLRDQKPYLAQGPVANKLIYAGYSCTQGWFCTPCTASPQLRGLRNILRLYIKRANCSEWEQIQMPSSVRSLVVLNLDNYASGKHPWGDLKPDYLEKKGFVEAHSDDGLIEIFGLKEGWHASFVMAELIKAKHIAQAAAIKFEMRGGEWDRAYVQMDGEPWKQPLIQDQSTIVEINKVPFHSRMINGDS